MRTLIFIIVMTLATGCVTDEKSKKNKVSMGFPEDLIEPKDAADFTDAPSGVKTMTQASGPRSAEDFTLDGSGEYDTWDAAAVADEDLAATTEEDVEEVDSAVTEPVATNPLTDMVSVPAADIPATSEAPISQVHVLYVKHTQALVHRQPETNATISRTLEQGETVVATIDGEWARLHEGEWVMMKDLSWNPVGRTKTGRRWGK